MAKFLMRRTVLVFVIMGCVFTLYIFVRKKPKSRHTLHSAHSDWRSLFLGASSGEFYEKFIREMEKEEYVKDILHKAHTVMKKWDVVLFGMLNEAYVPFTYSWLCNTRPLGIHGSVIFLTTDTNSTDLLQKDWPDINIVYLPLMDFKGDQEYSKAGYVRMMHLRTQVINILLRNFIPVLLFETDSLWIRNPIPIVLQTVQGHDMLVIKPTHRHGVLGGFLCLMPTDTTLEIWGKLSERMLELYNSIKILKSKETVADYTNDQVFLSDLLEKESRINLVELSNRKIVDGKWYTDFKEKDRKTMDPLVINNNWIRGNKEKIERAKQWGHWFLSDGLRCNMTQVVSIVKV